MSTQNTTNIHAAQRQLTADLLEMVRARAAVRRYWGECTAEALPLQRLDQASGEALRLASNTLHQIARKPLRERRSSLGEALQALEAAWTDTHTALDGWAWAGESLSHGDAALVRVREVVEVLQ